MAFLDEPATKMARLFSSLLLMLIYLTVFQVVIQERYPKVFLDLEFYFNFFEGFVLLIFTVEYLIRVFYSKNRIKYIFSFYGVIDALAVIPSILGFLGTDITDVLWLRVIKVFRIVRALKFVKLRNSIGGISGRLLPYIATAIAFKGVTVMLEAQEWWPEINNLNIVISVVGFALAVLLGTKLSVVNSRIYAIEDAVCRIAGALRDMQNQGNIKNDLLVWSTQLESTLKSSVKKKSELVREMREQTDILEEKLERSGIGGPNTAGFHRDVAYLLHRTTAQTPPAYEMFLKHVTTAYTLVVIFAVPGLTGLLTCILLVYVLGGMYFLIDDMDNPLDYGANSFIDVRLDALEFYNRSVTEV